MQAGNNRLIHVFFDPEEIQQNVWYWRRVRAGHLDERATQQGNNSYAFDADTVAKADRVFFQTYRRPPEPWEWATWYLFLLRQIAEDPTYSEFIPTALEEDALKPRFAPRSVSLRRVERSRRHASYVMPAILLGMVLLGIFSIAAASSETNIDAGPLILVMGGCFLGLALAGPLMRNAAEVVFVCPECGAEYDTAQLHQCRRCHLEFGGPPQAMHQPFGQIQPGMRAAG